MKCHIYLTFSEDAQMEKERIRMIKDQIEEELRQLEDEITACKWPHTLTHKQSHSSYLCVHFMNV